MGAHSGLRVPRNEFLIIQTAQGIPSNPILSMIMIMEWKWGVTGNLKKINKKNRAKVIAGNLFGIFTSKMHVPKK